LAPADGRPASPVLDERRAVEDMLLGIDIDIASYRVGLSQVRTNCCLFPKFDLKAPTNSYVNESVLLIILSVLVFFFCFS
jgi:hypothetical protein